MHHRLQQLGRSVLFAVFGIALGLAGSALAQTTAFSYQGKLTDAGNPATGNYDLKFRLFDNPTVGAGVQQGADNVVNPVAASVGVFTVTLDFGQAVFGGPPRYLEIGVRPGGSGIPYTVLAPRQPINSAPYAIQTLNTQQLGGVPASRYLASDSNGNFGIGTATPQALLHVNGSSWLQGGATVTGTNGDGAVLSVRRTGGDPFLLIDATPSSFNSVLAFRKNNLNRWLLFSNSTAEIGGNRGSDLQLDAYGDTGLGIANYLFVARSSGNVGIGTTIPSSKLEIAAQDGLAITGYQPYLTLKDSNAGYARSIIQGADGDFNFFPHSFIGGYPAMNIKSVSGNVGLGSPVPVHHLDINGGPSWTANGWGGAVSLTNASAIGWKADAAGLAYGIGQSTGGLYFFNSSSGPGSTASPANYLLQLKDTGDVDVTNALRVGGAINAAGANFTYSIFTGLAGIGGDQSLCRNSSNRGIVQCSSSLRYKDDVQTYTGGLNIVSRLRPISFTWKHTGKRDLGFGAEEVEQVEPQLTFRNEQGEIEGVKYNQITDVLVNAVNEQQRMIEDQRIQINALKAVVCSTNYNADICR